ncbi:uncharacterized protein FFUJ_02057 [Fusarium fujikuroi IMI 58289]|uniref:Ubiquitin-like domain-containing protein n=1 Tax=Gibberella fujikuroi (strain CBS 195.34 / IMI 58289 / NRRL A-6831) TaxID=1279085 RepID=S0DHN8_GIBF5|nr:uncharacterized protein FFUJ_02057 [Fusarium fujikuroi IMI 58289]KLP22905.1 uncharacterized protein LW94_4883 [Fusarium fujikuroi]CCT61466.1 uncharacterized protein FFUJ_02057 [Fusarium fujikuroi IMI 58289]SCO13020.1 uncharacterized protein FFM5_10488 [Fusarium fujikuroi]SCV50520.1 uncharacterized protein FFB14_11478 [Fusarium fujikuroi]
MSHHDQSLRDETWLPTREIQNFYQQMDLAVRELLDCISLCALKTCSIRILNGSRGVVDLPIKLLDASQSLILIPPGLCTSKQKFHNLLRIILRRQPWHAKIDQEEYVLEDKELTTDIGTENWDTKMLPGAEIFMTIISNHKGAVSDTCCPKCRAINIVKMSEGKRVKCQNCHVISNFVETNRVVKLPEDYADSPTEEPLLENAFRIRYLHEKSLTPISRRAPTADDRTFLGQAFTQFYCGDFSDFLYPQQHNLYHAQLLQYSNFITPCRGSHPQIPQLPHTISAVQAARRVPLRNASASKVTTGEGHKNR